MRGLLAAALFALLPAPVHADTVVNEDRVAACIADRRADPETCLDLVLQPCAHHIDAGIARACYARLRRRWEAVIAKRGGSVGRDLALDPICLDVMATRLGTDTNPVHAVRNACRVVSTVFAHFRQDTPAEPVDAEIESLEACVLETAATGDQESCIGLFTAECVAAGKSRDGCHSIETRHWLKIATAQFPTPCGGCPDGARDQEVILRLLDAWTTCRDESADKTLCRRDSTARIAMDVLLTTELQ